MNKVNTQQNGIVERKIGIYSTPLELYSFKGMFLSLIGERLILLS